MDKSIGFQAVALLWLIVALLTGGVVNGMVAVWTPATVLAMFMSIMAWLASIHFMRKGE